MARGRLKLVLTGALGVGLLTALVLYVGIGEVAQALSRADPLLLGGALAAYALFFAARGLRWVALLRPLGTRASAPETTGLTAVGWLINSIAPMKAGDVTRAAVLARRHRVSFASVFSSVAVERILDLLGLAVAAAVGLMLIPQAALPGWFVTVLDLAWILPVAALAGLFVAVRWRDTFLQAVTRGTAILPERARLKIRGFVGSCIVGAEGLFTDRRTLLAAVPLTVAMTALQMAVFTCLFLAFLPRSALPLVVAGVPFFILSFAISVTPGNVGTYEGAFAAIYAALGFPLAEIVPVAVLTHLGTFLIVSVLGTGAGMALGVDVLRPTPDPAHPQPEAPADAKEVIS